MVSQAPRENVAPQDHKDPKEEMEIKDQWVHPVQVDLKEALDLKEDKDPLDLWDHPAPQETQELTDSLYVCHMNRSLAGLFNNRETERVAWREGGRGRGGDVVQ